jgi:hypothetical protein
VDGFLTNILMDSDNEVRIRRAPAGLGDFAVVLPEMRAVLGEIERKVRGVAGVRDRAVCVGDLVGA